ncbi:MAG: hypothetical protein K0R48_1197 [Gammaproteobacteria bacterium]|nr:hypothetical protein [Gammaproteobacteria bacterium]
MSASVTDPLLLQFQNANFAFWARQNGTYNALLTKAIQDFMAVTKVKTILSSKEEAITQLISEKDINDYFSNSNGAELEKRITLIFECGSADIINYISMKKLFDNIAQLRLFHHRHEKTKAWLIGAVLRANATKAIAELIGMKELDQYLNILSIERILCVLSSSNPSAIKRLTPAHWDLLAREIPHYSFPPETSIQSSNNEASSASSPEVFQSPHSTPIKISNSPSLSFFAKDLVGADISSPGSNPSAPVKAPQIHLKIPRKFFSQWPPEPFAPIAPSNKKRRIDVCGKQS